MDASYAEAHLPKQRTIKVANLGCGTTVTMSTIVHHAFSLLSAPFPKVDTLSHCRTYFNVINVSIQLITGKMTALNALLQASKDENVWNRAKQEHILGNKEKKTENKYKTKQKVAWQAYVKATVTARDPVHKDSLNNGKARRTAVAWRSFFNRAQLNSILICLTCVVMKPSIPGRHWLRMESPVSRQ